MLVHQMFMALFLGIGNLRFPSSLLHDLLSSKDSVFETVMTVEAVGIFEQVGVFDVPPSIMITITDTGDVPGGVANSTDYELA